MLKWAIPLVHVTNAAAAEEFYCNRLGFRREFAHRADPAKSDPFYLGISRSWWTASMPYTRSLSKKVCPSPSSP